MRKVSMLALIGCLTLPACVEAQPYYGYGRPDPYWEHRREEVRERRREAYWEHRREREYEDQRRQQEFARQQQWQRW